MTPRQKICQESSSVRPKGQRLYGELHRHYSIIRFAEWKSTLSLRHVPGEKTVLVRDGMRFRPGFHGLLRGHDAAVNPKGEKAIPARSATIRGSAKQAVHPGEQAHPMLARNALQVHVAAHSAVHVGDISDRSRPGVKARVAGSATPGAQPCHSCQVILDSSSARTAGTVAMTDRTQQILFTPGKSIKRIRENLLQWQVPSARNCGSMYNETMACGQSRRPR